MERTYRILGRQLQIHLGDITRLAVDAIVSSENSDLIMDHAGGASVSGAIRRAEGEGMAATLARLGPIEPGRAVVTPTHSLPAKWIVHAAAVIKTEAGHQTSLEIVQGAVRSALSLAAGLGLESIAFPAFGVRATNLGVAASCQGMVEEIVAFLRRPSSIRRVVIALLDPGDFLDFFEEALRRGAQANAPLTLRVDSRAAPDAAGLSLSLSGLDGGAVAQAFSTALPRELVPALARIRDGAARRLRDLDQELLGLGRALWSLLPAPLQAALAADRERPLRLQLDEEIAWLPLELAHDGVGFLGERSVARHLVSRAASHAAPPRGAGPLSALFLAGDPRQLPASAHESRELVDLLWRRAGPRAQLSLLAGPRATRAAVRAALSSARLIHWCGHTLSLEDGAGPSWALADGPLSPAELIALAPLQAELVVLNSCAPQGGVAFPRALLLAGAQNVVGSLWEVEDGPAARFATHLYDQLCLGKTLGAALSSARSALRAEGAIHWLAYQHWGDPSARLFEPHGA